MKAEAFVIHVARATQRRPQVDRIVASCPLPTHVLDAVDAQLMWDADRAMVYRRHIHAPRYPFRIGAGEIACFLSHRKAWRAIVDGGLDAGLVFEDDVEVAPDIFRPALETALEAVDNLDLVQFQVRAISRPGPSLAERGGVTLHRPATTPLRAACNLYSRRAAGRLLELTETFDRPVDTFLQMHWLTGIHAAIAVPSGTSERSDEIGGTTIQATGRPLSMRIAHEMLRPIYRARVALRSASAARVAKPKRLG